MTCPRFEEILEELLRETPDPTIESISASLPDACRQRADEDPQFRQHIVETIWITRWMKERSRPMPSAGFVDRVVARLEGDRPILFRRSSRGVVLGSFAAIAATLLCAVLLVPPTQREIARSATPTTDERAPEESSMAVREPKPERLQQALRDVGYAYLALLRDVSVAAAGASETVAEKLEPSARDANPSDALPDERLLARADSEIDQDLARLGGAGYSLTDDSSLRTVRAGIEPRLRPITTSAISAFGFLWKEPVEAAE